MTARLPDGVYPFVDRRLPLLELQMIEAPAPLETLLRQVARDKGTETVSAELTCEFQGAAEAAFPVWQPAGGERLHMEAPKAEAIRQRGSEQ
jgi:hypothetical protein